MKIVVRLYGGLQSAAVSDRGTLDLPKDGTVADAIAALGFRSGEVWLTKLEDELVDRKRRLRSGDELLLIPPIGGG
jgi:sulfur carrier protein ThiS